MKIFVLGAKGEAMKKIGSMAEALAIDQFDPIRKSPPPPRLATPPRRLHPGCAYIFPVVGGVS